MNAIIFKEAKMDVDEIISRAHLKLWVLLHYNFSITTFFIWIGVYAQVYVLLWSPKSIGKGHDKHKRRYSKNGMGCNIW